MKDIRKLPIDKILKKFWDCLKISDGDGGSYSRPHQKSMSGAYIILAEYIRVIGPTQKFSSNMKN